MDAKKLEIIEILKQSLTPVLHYLESDEIKLKGTFAHKYNEMGATLQSDGKRPEEWNLDFFENLKIQNIYAELLNTEERFNNYEILFKKDLNTDANFWWDQEYYDQDVEGNKNQRKKK